MKLISYEIEEDDWADEPRDGGLVVFLKMSDGSVRWSVFHSPSTLAVSGDLIEGTNVRIHGGAEHLIVLSILTRSTVGEALRHLEATGKLLEFSRRC